MSNRFLIVDAYRSGLHDDFWTYFSPSQAVGRVVFEPPWVVLDALSAFPPEVAGRISNYDAIYAPGIHNFVDSRSGVRLTFDFNTSYEEDVLVHEQCWFGELASLMCLARLRLSAQCARAVSQRLLPLDGLAYDAVHIRNTDYSTDLEGLFNSLERLDMLPNIAICSDDHLTIAQFTHRFHKTHSVIRLSRFPDNDGRPLHGAPAVEQFDMNVDALVDLMALAFSRRIYFANVKETGRASGFSMLAVALQKNLQVARRLLVSPGGTLPIA